MRCESQSLDDNEGREKTKATSKGRDQTLVSEQWEGKIFAGDGFCRPLAGATSPVRDKGDDSTLGIAGVGGPEDVDKAVAAAAPAQVAWEAESYASRANLLRRVADELERRSGDLRDLLVRETGCIGGKADYEIAAARSELFEASALASRPYGEVLRTDHGGRLSWSERAPVGIVGVITPWNFPLVLGMRVIAPALALGNAVVLKPSPETPLSGGLVLAEVFARAGAPAGIFQVVPGAEEVGQRLVSHPGVGMVHFTGSTAVGREIAASAGRSLKKVSLELGGNNALVVLDDVDLDQAAMIGAWSTFHYQGQTCITAGRHIVLQPVAESYVDRLAARAAAISVGDPFRQQVGLGPMVNRRQTERGRAMLEDAVDGGAKVVAGGKVEGNYFWPTVVSGARPGMRLWEEEIFAPIAPVMVVEDEEEAVAVANNTDYGLVSSVLSGDSSRGLALARRLKAGMVHVNDATPQDEAVAPFGGTGSSGYGGRSGGEANLDEFTERRWLTVAAGPAHYPY